MKQIINLGISLMFLGVAGWIVKDVILVADPSPLGGNVETNVEDHQGELDTFRQSK